MYAVDIPDMDVVTLLLRRRGIYELNNTQPLVIGNVIQIPMFYKTVRFQENTDVF